MQRKEFLKEACAFGLCSCAVASIFAPAALMAEEPATPAEKPKEDWRFGFMQDRYAQLLTSLEKRSDQATLNAALEDVGRYCSDNTKMAEPFAGNPEGLLQAMRERWHAETTYDAEKGRIALAYPPMKECACALVRAGVTPGSVCQCSVGFVKRAFEVAFGHPVEVELKSSLLRGGERCAFEIRTRPEQAA